jgi:hypothetical protein
MLDQTPISKAIGYARNQRVALRRFLNDGRLPNAFWGQRYALVLDPDEQKFSSVNWHPESPRLPLHWPRRA